MSDKRWGAGGFTESAKEQNGGGVPLKPEQPGRGGGSGCSKHPARNAEWECEKCHSLYCSECAGTYRSCPSCGGVCFPLNKAQAGVAAAPADSFIMLLLDSFTYPLRGKGIILMVIGVIFFFMLFIMMALPVVRWIFLLIGGGFFCAFFMSVIDSSADGERELPDWPDVTNFIDDLAVPFFKFFGTFLVSYLPFIIYVMYWVRNPFSGSGHVAKVLEILGSIYFPMALISTALGRSYVFNPVAIFISIGRVFLHYAVALLFVAFVVFMGESGVVFLNQHLGYFGIFLGSLLIFYTITVQMRVYGIIYYVNQEKLGWF